MQDGPHDITGWTVLNPHLSCWCSHYLLKAPENTVIFSMFHDVSWVYSIRSPTYPPKILVASTSWIPLPHVATLLSQELKASCRKNLTKSEIQRAEGLKVEDWSSTISCSWTYPEIPNCAVLFRGVHWSLLYSADLYAENALVVWYGLARSKHLLRLYLELFFGV